MKKLLIASALTLQVFSEAPATKTIRTTSAERSAWLTGPLLCPSYSVVSKGGYNVEPYFFAITSYAEYDKNWSKKKIDKIKQAYNYTLIQLGLTDRFNVSFSPQFYYQSHRNHTAANIGDLILESYFLALEEDTQGALPGITLGFKANVPLGRYRNLSPDGFVSEAIGGGSWRPTVAFTIGKQIHLSDIHFLVARAFFGWQLKNSFPASGFHAYGGGYGTIGTLTMGTQYTTIVSFEYSFSRHGAFACDLQWQHSNKITFKGEDGYINFDRTIKASNGVPSSEQLSLAPALEYNFNQSVGLIAGCWFTLAGRNALAFFCPTIALNIEY
jgi:hypothetical protein